MKMIKLRKLIALTLTCIMLLALAACGSSSNTTAPVSNPTSNAGTTPNSTSTGEVPNDWISLDLTFATFLTDTNVCQGNITTLQEKLDEYMPGLVTITTYANGTLLKGADIYDGVLNGTCDIGYVQQDYTPARFPLSQILSYPGVTYNSAEVGSRVFTEWVQTCNPEEFQDVQFLFGISSGPYCVFTTTQLSSIDDFAGLQIRAGSINASIISALGATPVTMDISEVYEAMRSSLLDGIYTSFGACAFANLEEVGNYALIVPINSNPSCFVMNKAVFNSMPESQQEAFMQACEDTFEEYTATYQDNGLIGVERCETFASNVYVSFAEGNFLDELIEATSSLMDGLVADLDAQGYDGTGTLETVKELADKYNSIMTYDDYKALYPPDASKS